MARSVSAEKQREYDELKRFFVHWETHLTPHRVLGLEHPHNPINVLAVYERQLGVSRVLPGLKQAVNDILEDFEDFSPQEIAAADASLARAGAPTMSQLWQGRSRHYKAILRRGRLRNDTEYYLASSIVCDTASQVPPDELDLLDRMVANYALQRT